MRYAEMVIQFGYIVLFAPAFPLAPFFSMITNLIEIRINLNNMAYNNKRNIAMGSSGIGSWGSIIEFLTLVSIATNCGIIYFTSSVVPAQAQQDWNVDGV